MVCRIRGEAACAGAVGLIFAPAKVKVAKVANLSPHPPDEGVDKVLTTPSALSAGGQPLVNTAAGHWVCRSAGHPVLFRDLSALARSLSHRTKHWGPTGTDESGHLVIAKLSPEKYEQIDRAKILEQTNEAFGRPLVWSHPALRTKACIREMMRRSCAIRWRMSNAPFANIAAEFSFHSGQHGDNIISPERAIRRAS